MSLRLLAVVFVLAFVAGLAARIPLSAALALAGAREAGLDWRAAEGTVWSGAVRGLSIYDYPLGDVSASLAPASLLTLSPRVALSLTGAEAVARAEVLAGPRGGLRVRGGEATIQIVRLAAIDPRIRARGGQFTARNVEIAARGGRCLEASGDLSSDALTYGFEGGWRGPDLAGEVRCQDGVLVMALSGAGAGEDIAADARLGEGMYSVEVMLTSDEEEIALLAPLMGFFPAGGDTWRYEWSVAP